MAKIMIVDDSALSRRILHRILDPIGYQVIDAASAKGALEAFPLEKPDLVLLDLVMPESYGLDVLMRLRELDPRVRVIIATADVQISTKEMAETGGACGYVNKPFAQERVLAAVEDALRSVT